VLLIDIGMPRMNGIQATQRLRELDSPTQIVILSMHSSPFLVRQALSSGARGYLLKQSLLEELLLAVRAASLKKTYLSPSISHVVLDGFLSQADAQSADPLDELTPREKEVLQMIAEGDTSSVIAQKLSISANTVDKHRTNLMAKLDVHDIAGLTRLAIKYGLVFLEE
jgi:DNA-binding NarL/FixJ family response regulator